MRRLLQGCWSRGLKRHPLLQTSSPLKPKNRRTHIGIGTENGGTSAVQILVHVGDGAGIGVEPRLPGVDVRQSRTGRTLNAHPNARRENFDDL
jgi:hypothetical protein